MTFVQWVALGFEIIGVMTVGMTMGVTVWLMCSTGRARKQKPPAKLYAVNSEVRGNGTMTADEWRAIVAEWDRNGT